nr:MAG TPA_asm: hypothetical protein [Caudoviricetes sp.]
MLRDNPLYFAHKRPQTPSAASPSPLYHLTPHRYPASLPAPAVAVYRPIV